MPDAVNPQRFDPYQTFKFRVKWDGRYVAGVSRVSALRRTTEVVEHREGGEPSAWRKSPGMTRFDPITLERGVTGERAFEDWANLTWRLGGAPEVSQAAFRKDIVIELYNEAGQLVMAYLVHRAWVSAFTALPDLDANAGSVAIESLTLEHEGWERDAAVKIPPET